MKISPRVSVSDRTDDISGIRIQQHRRTINGTTFRFIRRTYPNGGVLTAVVTPGDVRHSLWSGR